MVFGCGAGRLLLAYLKMLDVEGVDISADQESSRGRRTISCPVRARDAVTFDLPHRYNTIYIPCGSFQLMGRKSAIETLKRCRSHLESGGVLAFNVSPAKRTTIWIKRIMPGRVTGCIGRTDNSRRETPCCPQSEDIRRYWSNTPKENAGCSMKVTYWLKRFTLGKRIGITE